MRRAAGMPTLHAWYDQLEAGVLLDLVRQQLRVKQLDKQSARQAKKHVAKAYANDSARVFAKRAAQVGGQLRIVADPPLITPIEDLIAPGSEWEDPAPLIKKLLASYRRTLGHQGHPLEEFRYVHAARKVVGVGSVGTRCYILLLTGRDRRRPAVPAGERGASLGAGTLRGNQHFPHHGQRVVMGQRLMQAATDIFLGWQRIKGLDGLTRDYYVRQFHDWKGGADVERLLVPGATQYAQFCGATLARAHARWGDRIAIAAYLGRADVFDRAIGEFSAAYADQNERDYEAFNAAVNSGRLIAQTGI